MKFRKNLKEMRGFNEILSVDHHLNYSFRDHRHGLSLNDWLSSFVMVNRTFITARLNACRISSGVESRFPSSFVDLRLRLFEKAPESLSVSVSFSDAGKKDSTLKPLDVPREDCILISTLLAHFARSLCSLTILERVKATCLLTK